MKAKKFLAALTSIGILLGIPLAAAAESSIGSLITEFELGEEKLPQVTANINPGYVSGGIIHSYGTGLKPVKLDGDLFDEALPYMCYGGGSSNRWDSLWEISLDIPEYDSNDAVYVSFYYKSASVFTGENGAAYAGQDLSSQARYKGDASNRYPIWIRMEDNEYSVPVFYADGEWHKLNFYAPAGNLRENVMTLNFLDMSKPQYLLLAGFRTGVVRFPDGMNYSNDRAYTELGWHLQSMDINTLTVNGKEIQIEPDTYAYSISAEGDNIEVTSGASNAVIVNTERLSDGVYEVTAAAPGYNKALGAAGEPEFRKRVNTGNDEFASNGSIIRYTVKNSDMTAKYTINLLLKSVNAGIKVNGEEKTALDGCTGGGEIALDVTYLNVKNEEKTYMAVLVIYKDGAVKAVIPKRERIAADVRKFEASYTYTLPEDDYTGCTADYFVIDTDAMYDCAK